MYHDLFVNLRWSFGGVEELAVVVGESAVSGDVIGTVSVLLDSRPHDTGSMTISTKLQESQSADLEKLSGSVSRNDEAEGTMDRGVAEPLPAVLGKGSSCGEPVTILSEC